MKIIQGDRQTGKTTKAIEWLKEKPYSRIIVVITEHEKQRLMEQYDLTYQQVETWRTVLHHYHIPTIKGEYPYPKEGKEFFLDNIEMIFNDIFHHRLGGFSFSLKKLVVNE